MLEAVGLSKRYANGTIAVENLSFTAGHGVFGLLGPNGSGKTTLMSMLATVTQPTSGTFRWQGHDGVREPDAVRRTLGYLPQDFGVYGRLTAREFLFYLARLKGLAASPARERVAAVLEAVNLHSAADRLLESFSGGMRQRVGIAQALVGEPALVIVDEPTVGLDPEERIRFRNLLSAIAATRVVILSTHIVSDVEAVAASIALMRKGRLLSAGPPADLLQRARGQVFTLVTTSAHLPEVERRVVVANVAHRSDGVHVRFVAPQRIYDDAVDADPTLEDAYLLFASADDTS
jgi:ABC-2 type transport system ATP-binding protein